MIYERMNQYTEQKLNRRAYGRRLQTRRRAERLHPGKVGFREFDGGEWCSSSPFKSFTICTLL